MAANLRAMFVAASNTFAYLSTFKDSLYSKDSWYELSIISANLGSFMNDEKRISLNKGIVSNR